MTRRRKNEWFLQAVFAGGLACGAAFFPPPFLSGQELEEPVAIRRVPGDKPAIPRPSPAGAESLAEDKAAATETGEKKGMGETDAAGKDGDAGETAGDDGVPETSMLLGLERMFPVGRIVYGVRIPSYSGDYLTSVVTSETMKRVDQEHVDMEDLVIYVYSGGQPDSEIRMDKAIYDMEEDKLTSRRTPPEILHSRFTMVGDKLTFDREARTGHMTGNVKMTIFNVDSFLPEAGVTDVTDVTGEAGDEAQDDIES